MRPDAHVAPSADRFTFWCSYLQVVSAAFALLGLFWAVLGRVDPVGFYERWMAASLWGLSSLPPDARRTMSFMLGPLGATCAGYFLLQLFIVRFAFARRERWAYLAIAGAVAVWFAVDTTTSLAHRAYFNVILINLPALALVLPPLWFTRRDFFPRRA